MYKTRLQFYEKFFQEIAQLSIEEKQALIEGGVKTMIATDSDTGRTLGYDLANAFGGLFDVPISAIRTDFPIAVEHPAIKLVKESAPVRRLYSRVLLENVKRDYGLEAYTEIVDASHWRSEC